MDVPTAVNALKELPLFRNSSLRLLTDLVESEHLEQMMEGAGSEPPPHTRIGFVFDAAPSPRHESLWARMAPSPCLLRSLDRELAAAMVGGVEPTETSSTALHLLWLTQEIGLEASLEAFAELLAAAIGEHFGEPAAVLVLHERGVELRVWREHAFVRLAKTELEPDDLRALLEDALDRPEFAHVVIVHPRDPYAPPASLAGLRVHRLVYLTRREFRSLPHEAPMRLLADGLVSGSGEPLFSSFVATVLLPARRVAARHFATVSLDESPDVEDEDEENTGPTRVRRDRCPLDVDPVDVTRRWRLWRERGTPERFAPALLADEDSGRSMRRWARAVTNRRVGVALSGGGAACYRMVPLLDRLCREGLEYDLIAGISGGTVLGAYYCRYGLPGLERYVRDAMLLQVLVPLALVDSRVLSRVMDGVLGQARLDELETQLVALTTRLADDRPPEAHAVVGGTLGEAIQVSGAAPLVFAPVDKDGHRYADGATAAPIPAQVLRRFGADLVIACNAIPGPASSIPFAWIPGVALAYTWSPLGRIVDLWTTAAFLLQRVSREAAEDAHVFVEASSRSLPIIESFFFFRARQFGSNFVREEQFEEHVERCLRRWREFVGIDCAGARGSVSA